MIGPSSDGLAYLLDDTANIFTVTPGSLAPHPQGLIALGGNDVIMGSGDGDLIQGNQGDDQLFGDGGNDTLLGGQGDDFLAGQLGDDQLFGGQGNDTLFGGQGNDLLLGLEGNDILAGDLGQDTLTGGEGKDIFVLAPDPGVRNPELADLITDFNPTMDKIGLRNNLTEFNLSLEPVSFLNPVDTVIRVQESGEILGVVANQMPDDLRGRFLDVDRILSADLAIAQPLGTLDSGNPFNINHFVGGGSPTRVYRFSTLDVRQFQLTLDGLTADADVQLIRDGNNNLRVDTGEVIASSSQLGTQSESIKVDRLEPGTYYVQVAQYDGESSYFLNLSVQPVGATITGSSTALFNERFGFGLVDASRAISQVLGGPLPSLPDLGGFDWGRDLIQAPEVWSQGITGEGVVIALLDSGIDYTHPELMNSIWVNPGESLNGSDDDGNGFVDDVRGWDFVGNDNDPLDENGHGTHLAGLITANLDGLGITGVAPEATIMPLRILDSRGNGSVTNAVAAIYYAVNNGADIINLSFGGRSFDPREQEAIRFAESQGVIVVSSSGNRGAITPDYPSRLSNEVGIAVGAVQRNQQISSFSNSAGPDVISYVVGPGGDGGIQDENDIYSTVPQSLKGSLYGYLAGTSMATAHVSGVVALLKQVNPNLTPAEIKQILVETANPSVFV